MQEKLEARLRERPEDADSWRVYSDWLLEQGDGRGEAISLLARLQQAELSEQEREALQQKYTALCGEEGLAEARWRHGFLLGAKFDSVFAFEQTCARPIGPLLTEARFSGSLDLEQLLASPYLARLRTLSLRGNYLYDEDILPLAASQRLHQLEKLEVYHNYLGDEGAKALAHSPWLGNLRVLNLVENDIGDEGARALATLAGVSDIFLGGNQISQRFPAPLRLGPQQSWRAPPWRPRERSVVSRGHPRTRSFYLLVAEAHGAGFDHLSYHVCTAVPELERAIFDEIIYALSLALSGKLALDLCTIQADGPHHSLALRPHLQLRIEGYPPLPDYDLELAAWGSSEKARQSLTQRAWDDPLAEFTSVQVDWERLALEPLRAPVAQPHERVALAEDQSLPYGWSEGAR